jgi:SpoVK/Ycf46/Vps4 family AAA+-type ATPase
MYGTWLTWTQTKKEDVFVVATTNGVQNLPPPALRRGRFDEIFFVDLPNEAERKIIFEIHLNKRGWNPEEYKINTNLLAIKTANTTGSEIEQIVVQSLIDKVKKRGFGKENPLTTEDIDGAIQKVRTSYQLNPEEADGIREWAKRHGVTPANKQQTASSENKQVPNKRLSEIQIEEGDI